MEVWGFARKFIRYVVCKNGFLDEERVLSVFFWSFFTQIRLQGYLWKCFDLEKNDGKTPLSTCNAFIDWLRHSDKVRNQQCSVATFIEMYTKMY